jgi:hypothetical protein
MKYLFLLIVLLSCKSDPKVVKVHTPNDTTAATSVKRDTSSIDIHNPYETGKDTIRLNKVMDEIFNFRSRIAFEIPPKV